MLSPNPPKYWERCRSTDPDSVSARSGAALAPKKPGAAAAGCRFLQVDASADSRPILRRLGFQQLATTTPFVRNP